MTWFIVTAVLIVIIVIAVGLAVTGQTSQERNTGFGAAAGAALILLIFTAYNSFHSVPFNNVGVITTFGAITGQTGDGLVFVAPWSSLTVESTRVNRQDYDLSSVPSIENQSLHAHVVISYHVDGAKVLALYHDYGENWYQNLVDPFVQATVNNVTGTFKAVDAHNHPVEVNTKILAALRADLSTKRHGSDVDIVAINGTYDLPQPLQDAILNKQVAIQNAAAEQNKVLVAKYQGEQQLSYAQQKARANLVLARSLTPALVQYEAIQKLQGDVKVCVIPSGTTILNPCAVAGTTTK